MSARNARGARSSCATRPVTSWVRPRRARSGCRVRGRNSQVPMTDGSTLFIQLPRPGNRPPGGPPPAGGVLLRFPINFAWMLGLMALAVALGSYPIVRRLTKRLEALDQGVRQWGDGNLSLRLPEQGQDEVAALAQGFNAAAQRVQALLLSHKALLANASHELRSPLARIRMGLELMGPQATTTFKEEITRNIQELDQLVDEILLASRLDASEADLGAIESVDMLGVLAEECGALGAELQAPPDSANLIVQGVAKLLRRMVRNLLENARRHGAGSVIASARRDADAAVLTVTDSGPGGTTAPARAHLRAVLSAARRERTRRRRRSGPGPRQVHRLAPWRNRHLPRSARRRGQLRGAPAPATGRHGLIHAAKYQKLPDTAKSEKPCAVRAIAKRDIGR